MRYRAGVSESLTHAPANRLPPRLEPDPLEAEFARAQTMAKLFGEEHELRVAGYPLLRKIGSGAASIVFESRAPRQRRVALKISRHRARPSTRTRMQREARACARLQHPNIVELLDANEHQGRMVMVMELADQNLRHWSATKPPISARAAMLRQALEGLAAAHTAGYVHRDFKPDNVLIFGETRAAVADFGLALDLHQTLRESGRLTNPGDVLGTADYMAPEQRRGLRIDARADLWAWAAVAWETLMDQRLDPDLRALPTPDELQSALESRLVAETSLAAWPAAIVGALALRAELRPTDAGELLATLAPA